MTMHLAHPALTTTGKKKGKHKYKSADAKRRAERDRSAYEAMLAEYGISKKSKRSSAKNVDRNYVPKTNHLAVRNSDKIPSLPSSWATCAKPPEKKYTGVLIKGICTMHKSNAVPVINEQEMIDISRMRRG